MSQISDTERLSFILYALKGFARVMGEHVDIAKDLAEQDGREKANSADDLEAFRKIVDAAIESWGPK